MAETGKLCMDISSKALDAAPSFTEEPDRNVVIALRQLHRGLLKE